MLGGLHSDERRKADKLKKKKRNRKKEWLGQAREPSGPLLHAPALHAPQLHYPPPLGAHAIKEEPEDDITIPLRPPHAPRLPSPPHCKQEPPEEERGWDGRNLQESPVKTETAEPSPGSRTVFRQGKQVVFRDEDGSGEDEDIMVDSGKASVNVPVSGGTLLESVRIKFVSLSSRLPRRRLVGPGHLLLHEALRRPSHDRVQHVQHLDPPVLCQDPQEPRARDVHVSELQGHARHAGRAALPPLAYRASETPARLILHRVDP